MNRKNLFWIVAMAFLVFTACSKDEQGETTGIKVSDSEQLDQTVYADDIISNDGVSFTTTGPWTSVIQETTRTRSASTVKPDWISISPESGKEAGDYTIQIALSTNYTGEDRSATIIILCGDSKITITITQKGEDEKGEKPNKHVTGITLNKTELTLESYDSQELIATILPEDATNKTVLWTSSNTSVAMVHANGNVSAFQAGTAVITATTEDGAKTAKCTVTVVNPQPTGSGTYTFRYNDGSETASFKAARVMDSGSTIRIEDKNGFEAIYFHYKTKSGNLEAGTYTWGSSSRGWTCQKVAFGNVHLYFEYGISDPGTVDVSISGETFTITLDWKGSEDGDGGGRKGTVKGSYTGKIKKTE